MPLNKDIIIRLISTFIFIAITLSVLVPLFLNFIKKKMPGQNSSETDIDTMIRRQKERMKAQYGLHGTTSSPISNWQDQSNPSSSKTPISTKQIQNFIQENKWGNSQFQIEIQKEIAKNYSYTITESKIGAFLLLCEKRKLFSYLTSDHQSNELTLKNFIITSLLFHMLIEEIRDKQFFILEKVAQKLKMSQAELGYALQIKLLMMLAPSKKLKDERIFSDRLILSEFSEDSIREGIDLITSLEANLWAKSLSLFFEELSLYVNYATFIKPIEKLRNKKDLATAYSILGNTPDQTLEEIKKNYKRIALVKHPDKISSQKLPKYLEQKALTQFALIQEAYEIIVDSKK